MKKADYHEYLKSDAWQIRRQWKLEQADFRCQVCNQSGELHVHHRTYDRVGRERENDLTVLCKGCHARYHDKTREPNEVTGGGNEVKALELVLMKAARAYLVSPEVATVSDGLYVHASDDGANLYSVIVKRESALGRSLGTVTLLMQLVNYEFGRLVPWQVVDDPLASPKQATTSAKDAQHA